MLILINLKTTAIHLRMAVFSALRKPSHFLKKKSEF